jgi:hypothetical protein
MKRLIAALAVLVVLGVVGVGSSTMGALTNDVYINTWPQGQPEGPFEIKIYADSTTGVGYETSYNASTTPLYDGLAFCVETHQYFTPGGIRPGYNTFNIDGIGTQSVNTGRVLSGYSAWVFTKFESLNLPLSGVSGAAPGGYSWASVLNDYQNAIWAGMVDDGHLVPAAVGSADHSEYGSYTGQSLALDSTEFTDIGISWAEYVANTGGDLGHTGSVAIIQIQGVTHPGDGYTYGQDQTVLFDSGQMSQDPVPEPTSLAIWAIAGGLGAAGLRFKRRREGAWSDESRQSIMGVVHGRPRA